MASETGEVLHAPHYTGSEDPGVDVDILGSYDRLIQKGVTLEPDNGVIESGTVLGIVTATGRAAPYADAGVGGLDTAVGVLRKTVDTTGSDPEDIKVANVVLGGVLKNGALTGLTAAAIADLNGRVDPVHDYFIF